jgi:hypothetical protein
MKLNFKNPVTLPDSGLSVITGRVVLYLLISLIPLVLTAQNSMHSTTEHTHILPFSGNSGLTKAIMFDLISANDKITPRPVIISGFQFTQNFTAGIGVGFTPYDDPLSLVPLFIDLNYKLLNSGISPFASLKAGYGFSVKTEADTRVDNHNGGLTINPGTGIYFPLGDRTGLSLNFGFNIDNASFEQQLFNGGTLRRDLTYKRLNFGLAFTF